MTEDRRHLYGRRASDRHGIQFSGGQAIVVAIIVVASAVGFFLTARAINDAEDAKNRLAAEVMARQAEQCDQSIEGRRALRGIVTFAYSTPSAATVLPPDPAVPPATIAYLQRLINAQASSSAARQATLATALATIPPLRCVHGIPTPTAKPAPPLPTSPTTRG